MATKKSGRIKRKSEMPEDLIATSSKFSPSLPNVIMEESSMAMGRARLTRVALANMMNLMSVKKSSPLPTRSSIYFHNICIINTNSVTKKVAINGGINALRISLSNFFIKI